MLFYDCQKRTDMNYSLYSATWLTRKTFSQCLMIFSTQFVKIYIISWMSKKLEALIVCFGIKKTGPKKWVCLRESNIPFSDLNGKILGMFKHIFYPNIYVSESVTLPTLSQELQRLNTWEDNFVECCTCKLLHFLFAS